MNRSDLVAIIGGTGLTQLSSLEVTGRQVIYTPFGEPSAPLTRGAIFDHEVVFLPRHGLAHTIPPHKVNYRANVWALREIGVERVIAVNTVGGITDSMEPVRLAFPDQSVDYTYNRPHSFFEEKNESVTHIEFTEPYNAEMRAAMGEAARAANVPATDGGTYAVTQGPRLETAAEVDRLDRDGCDIVGMTGMPEAALARELGLEYACCAVVVNWAAGRGSGTSVLGQIESQITQGMDQVRDMLQQLLPRL